MEQGPTFGVLCALTGGYYFGEILSGVVRAASAAGGRAIVIQTSDAGLDVISLNDPSDLALPLSWRHVSGFVVILNAVTRQYVSSIRAAGKPVVTVSDAIPGFRAPVVMADGRPGVRRAVEHLIEHGHRRIAFAGCMHPVDVRQRYETYQATLRAHGIEPEPELFYEIGNNEEPSGEDAARQMLAAGLPSTAVVTGSDANAIGLMRRLRAAGVRLPEDQAVIGFDDMVGVGCLSPALSTVHQPFDVLGATAVELLVRTLRGEPVPAGPHFVDTTFVLRESCGCPPGRTTRRLLVDPRTEPRPDDEQGEVRVLSSGLALGAWSGADAAGTVNRAAEVIAAALSAPGRPASDETERHNLEEALAEMFRLDPRPEAAVGIAAWMRQHADEHPAAEVHTGLWQALLSLVRVQAHTAYLDGARHQSDTRARYEVSMDLLRSHEEDPRALHWLRRTGWRGGCLGTWRAGPDGSALLDIVGLYDQRDPHRKPEPSLSVPPDAFPPPELLAMAEPGSGDMITVIPVRANDQDWGLLALVAPPDTEVPTGREMTNQYAALLTVALNHDAMVRALHEQEARLRQASLHDSLTGLPNRALFLDGLEHALKLTRRDATRRYAVLFIDVDRFKWVNDTLGHNAGDQLLVQIADRLRSSLRDGDVAARFGGDEFAVLVDAEHDPRGPARLAERLHEMMARPFELDSRWVAASVSIGIAHQLDRYESGNEILRDADVAMYAAKGRGRGTSAVFTDRMRSAEATAPRVPTDQASSADGDGRGRLGGGEVQLRA